MKLVWLNGKFFYDLAFLFTLGFKDFPAILCDFTHKYGLAAFGCPYEMEHEKVYPVFVPLIVCYFHVYLIPYIQQPGKPQVHALRKLHLHDLPSKSRALPGKLRTNSKSALLPALKRRYVVGSAAGL
jgi:hypothetical protein